MTVLRPYAEYKDSGVPWLGQVPHHWEVRPLKRWAAINARVLSEDTPADYAFDYIDISAVGNGQLVARPQRLRFAQAPSRARRVLRMGDTLLSTVRTYLKAVLHVPGDDVTDLIASTGFAVLTPRPDVESRLLTCAVGSAPFADQLTANSVGIAYPAIAESRVGSLAVALPTERAEQRQIVALIRLVNARTRSLIRAKRRMIELLNEQKQAIIQHAVTRGLDPTAPLKPSGSDWMGAVPRHWEMVRLKQCVSVISKGTTPSTEGGAILDAGPVRFLKAENIAGGRIRDRPRHFIDEQTDALLRRSRLRAGDVLFVIAGATLGKTAVVDAQMLPANTNQAVAFLRPHANVLSAYLALWLQSARVRELTWLNAVQSAQPNLAMGDLGAFPIPLPSVQEQHAIMRHLHVTMPAQGMELDRAHREIDLIREYRTRLIADVVTGKLDVRHVEVPDAPEDDVAEPEDVDDDQADAEDTPDAEEAAG